MSDNDLTNRLVERVERYIEDFHRFSRMGEFGTATERRYSAYEAVRILGFVNREMEVEMNERLREAGL